MRNNTQTVRNVKKDKTSGFVSGVLILSVSTFLCKVIGLFFKIPIIDIIGIDAMAYFSSAYNIYMLLNSISAAGLPVAMSILISRNVAQNNAENVKRIFKLSLSVFLIFGVAGTLILLFGAFGYSSLIGIDAAAPSVVAIAPTLLFICISGAIRGYFQGHEFMVPTAVSQLIESAGKLILGIGFALLAIRFGMGEEYTAAAAVLGLSAGVMISMIYLIIRKRIYSKRNKQIICNCTSSHKASSKRILSELFVIALPITLSSCITSLTSLADTALITNRLVAGGYSEDAAVTLYSSYTNLAIPLFNLPPALITAVAVSLVPALTSSVTRRCTRESDGIFTTSVRLSLGLALPAAAGMSMFSRPILDMLYRSEPEACSFAAPLLSVLGSAIVFSCLTTVCNAVLQAYLKPILPIIAMGAGAAVKIALEFILVGSRLAIYGAPISTVACTFTILFVDLIFVTMFTPHRISFTDVFRTMSATVISIGASGLVFVCLNQLSLSSTIVLISAIAVAVVLYAIFALLFGVIRYSDIARISFMKKIGDKLKKYKLIRD